MCVSSLLQFYVGVGVSTKVPHFFRGSWQTSKKKALEWKRVFLCRQPVGASSICDARFAFRRRGILSEPWTCFGASLPVVFGSASTGAVDSLICNASVMFWIKSFLGLSMVAAVASHIFHLQNSPLLGWLIIDVPIAGLLEIAFCGVVCLVACDSKSAGYKVSRVFRTYPSHSPVLATCFALCLHPLRLIIFASCVCLPICS